MSTIDDFNRIEDCDKIDPNCIDAYLDVSYDADTAPTTLCIKSSWGGDCLDLEQLVKAGETCTTMYLSPDTNPNCLVYEPECGDNICINGEDLARIIPMTKLKDVDQNTSIANGGVYMYDNSTHTFKPFDLSTALSNLNTTIQNMSAAITNLQNRMSTAEGNILNLQNRMTTAEGTIVSHGSRITTIEGKLTPPSDAPSGVTVMFGNINMYSDPNVVIDSNTGLATTVDKTHGLYSHLLANSAFGDEIFG
jgi:hypothetical protein